MIAEVVLMRSKSRYESVEIICLSPVFNLVRKEVQPRGRGRKTYWSGRVVRLPRWQHVVTLTSFSKEGLMRCVRAVLESESETMEVGKQ